ncbi:MAG: SprT-like domain-containing protein [Phycisphaerae bacterium]|nr:SprT-like domain-containing protein [Phycisphaerae bacterium]
MGSTDRDAGCYRPAPRAAALDVSDLWTPRAPLPTGPVLRAIAERIARRWDMPELLRHVRIGYNSRLRTTAGRAVYDDARVELNPHLLGAHRDQLVATLAHELAHLAVRRRYGAGAAPHGREFRTLLRAVNLSPDRCHAMPAAKRLRRRRYLYLHRCSDCGQTFIARRVRRDCYCRYCGEQMTWDVFRAPHSAVGRRALERLAAGASGRG